MLAEEFLTEVGQVYSAMQMPQRAALRQRDYVETDVGPRQAALKSKMELGVEELWGFGGHTAGWEWPGAFVRPIVPTIVKNQRVVGWLPGCLMLRQGIDCIAQDWIQRPGLGTSFAAIVGHLDIGWDSKHEAVARALLAARYAVRTANEEKSVARVAYDAILASAGTDQGLRMNAMMLGVYGSLVKMRPDQSGSGGGCPFVEVLSGGNWVQGNSILSRDGSGISVDLFRLRVDPSALGGRYRLRIRENEQERTALDQVALAGIDHTAEVRALSAGGRYLLGTPEAAYRVTRASGDDVTALVSGFADKHFLGDVGETLYVELREGRAPEVNSTQANGLGTTEDEDPFMMESMGKELPPEARSLELSSASDIDTRILNETGILIQTQDAEGVWRTRRHYYARADFDESLTDSIGSAPLRLVFVGRHRVRFIGRLVPTVRDVTPTVLTLASAQHTRLGNVRSAVLNAGGQVTYLVPGDTLNLEFSATSVPEGMVRDYFLVTRGSYSTVPSSSSESPIQPADGASWSFALGPARPNPTTGRVTFSYTLGTDAEARMRIYDVAGRLLKDLVDGLQSAGPHEVVWDGRTNAGQKVPAGVYFYRLEAGGWHSERKLIVITQ